MIKVEIQFAHKKCRLFHPIISRCIFYQILCELTKENQYNTQ